MHLSSHVGVGFAEMPPLEGGTMHASDNHTCARLYCFLLNPQRALFADVTLRLPQAIGTIHEHHRGHP